MSAMLQHLDWLDERIANGGNQAMVLNGSICHMDSAAQLCKNTLVDG